MENNFYVGTIKHKKKILKNAYNEKVVLYKKNETRYLDLIKDKEYSTNTNKHSYVKEETIKEVNVDDFNIDYIYLLNRHNNVKRKKKILTRLFTKK